MEETAKEKREEERRARSMVARLSFASTDESLASTLSSIRLLSKEDASSRSLLVEAGLVPHLLPHLLHSPPPIQELSSATLLNLSISCPRTLMSTPSLLFSLSRALALPSSPDPVLQNVSATVCSLLSVDAFRPIVGSKPAILASLLSLLRSPSPRTVKDSLRALFALSLYALNRPVLVCLDAVPALFSLLLRDDARRRGIMEDATAVVAQVAGCYESVEAFRGVSGVRVLAGVAGRSGRTRENAVSALLNLTRSGGDRALGDIREVEGVEELLEEVLESGSERGRAKAEELLKILRLGRGCYQCWSGDSEILDDSSSMLPSTSWSSSSASVDASG